MYSIVVELGAENPAYPIRYEVQMFICNESTLFRAHCSVEKNNVIIRCSAVPAM